MTSLATIESKREGRNLHLTLSGTLDADSVPDLVQQVESVIAQAEPPQTLVDGTGVTYCDGAGVGLLLFWEREHRRRGAAFEVRGLAPPWQRLWQMYQEGEQPSVAAIRPPRRLVSEVGVAVLRSLHDSRRLVAFGGELMIAMGSVIRSPRRVRWKEAWFQSEVAGVNALPIVALISLLMGLIMAFQSAIPLKSFGADVFVADLVAISLLRELGPLITAIILAGRTGSAFAAEIGTMKVNEEIDALTTMGLDPVQFLVVPRILATVLTAPLLVMFANLCGLIGGCVVVLSFGYPFVTYVNQVAAAVSATDLLGGLFKSLVFGFIVAAVGCVRGLQTRTGASAVGESATNAVVSGIFLIIATDGLFAVLFYVLGI